MKYLIGSKKEFYDFVNLIKSEDKVGILTHNDLDGIASAIFLEKILESRGIKLEFIDFLGYSKGMFERPLTSLKGKGITKLFLTDLSADSADLEGFENLRKEFDCFLIDHHPIVGDSWDKKNVIKTETNDCAGLVLYNLAKDFFDVSSWKWLVLATMVSEWSYKKRENMDILEKTYSGITIENLRDFECSKNSNMIGAALVYYRNNLKKVYSLIKKKDLESFRKIDKIIQHEIDSYINLYKKEAEFYPEKNLYFYYHTPKYEISSIIATILSRESGVFLFALDIGENKVKISARNNFDDVDVNLLMRKGIVGLEKATGGGHKRAAAAIIMKKDLNKFKENILK